ncbi:amidohydrolase [Pseudalkalibacillus decolorationis]|uniref:amidohydrolase n=1 Tax=Pseudalkalibacillus decolorationis TaxID=163879 RepID=UPI00214887F8|nr:amidohydrolase [Pseudalkalibacillus decolorationis]
MILIENGTIIVGTGDVIKEGKILIKEGKIEKIGCSSIESEHVTTVIDAGGKVVSPGLIDVHTHLGVHEEGIGTEGHDFNETSDPITPEVRAIDGINPREKGFEDARKAGVTTVQVLPGSANVIGGEMVTLKTVGTIVDEMVIRQPSGMKAAFGENPKRLHGTKGKAPITRMGIAALFRKEMRKAQQYLDKKDRGKEVDFDLGLENLCKVLRKEVPLRAHAHRSDDIVTLIRLAKEFNIEISIEHCTEGHHIADYVAEHGFHASIGPTMSTRSKIELSDKGWNTPKVLAEAGVPISITTDHPVVGIEYLLSSAATAVKYGLDEKEAWKSITLTAARHLGIDDRVGSLEEGKDADIVIWSGDPFDLRNSVETTFINGEIVYKKDE